jgi:hypothetical protein
MNQYIIAHLDFSPTKEHNQVHCPKFYLVRFPFTTVIQNVPGRGYSAEAVHFQVVQAHYAEPSVNQA